VILCTDAIQVVILLENAVSHWLSKGDKIAVSELQLYLNLLILMAYFFLTVTIRKVNKQADNIAVISCFIFAV
jgi:hypothetical protein